MQSKILFNVQESLGSLQFGISYHFSSVGKPILTHLQIAVDMEYKYGTELLDIIGALSKNLNKKKKLSQNNSVSFVDPYRLIWL